MLRQQFSSIFCAFLNARSHQTAFVELNELIVELNKCSCTLAKLVGAESALRVVLHGCFALSLASRVQCRIGAFFLQVQSSYYWQASEFDWSQCGEWFWRASASTSTPHSWKARCSEKFTSSDLIWSDLTYFHDQETLLIPFVDHFCAFLLHSYR